MKKMTNNLAKLQNEKLTTADQKQYKAGLAEASGADSAELAVAAPCPCVECTCGKRDNIA